MEWSFRHNDWKIARNSIQSFQLNSGWALAPNIFWAFSYTHSQGWQAIITFTFLSRKENQCLHACNFQHSQIQTVNSRWKQTIAWPFCELPFNPFPFEWVLRALIDFTLSNARRFYSSMGNLSDGKGLRKGLQICSCLFSHYIKKSRECFREVVDFMVLSYLL